MRSGSGYSRLPTFIMGQGGNGNSRGICFLRPSQIIPIIILLLVAGPLCFHYFLSKVSLKIS